MMDKKVKKLWVEALESGKYRQGTGRFCKTDNSRHNKYCCLGVLNKICDLGMSKEKGFFPGHVLDKLGLTAYQQDTLIDMNDDEQKSFKEIAAYIRKEL